MNGRADMFFYIIIGVSILIISSIIISNISAFQRYNENDKLDDDTAEMFVSSFDGNCQENTSEDIISKKSKIERACPEFDLVEKDDLIRLRRMFRNQSVR